MDLFLVMNGATLALISEDSSGISSFLDNTHQSFLNNFSSSSDWTRVRYATPQNFAAAYLQHYKVFYLSIEGSITLPQNWLWERTNSFHDLGIREVTQEFFTIEEASYEGSLKLFATVVKRGIKSSGMRVIVDPQFSGHQIRPIQEYQSLMGTFTRIKASVNIEGRGWETLFYAPESLGDFETQTQQISGNIVVFS